MTNLCECISPYVLLENGTCGLVPNDFNANCTGKPYFIITNGYLLNKFILKNNIKIYIFLF